MAVKLTREQRAEFFAGNCPVLEGEGKCPIEAGHSFGLSSRLSVTVTRVRHPKTGGWKLDYTVYDGRDPVRVMRRNPPIHVDENPYRCPVCKGPMRRNRCPRHGEQKPLYRPSEPSPESIDEAAQESAYSSQPSSLSSGGEAIDQLAQKRMSARALRNKGQQQTVNQLARERYELERRLERARGDAERRGVDISSPLRVIERQLKKIEGRVYDGRAA